MSIDSFVERANRVRKRIPFGYWIAYDLVMVPVMLWVGIERIWWAFPAALMWCVAVFFDVNEAIVKWDRRQATVPCPECGLTYSYTRNEGIARAREANPVTESGQHIAKVCPTCRRIDFVLPRAAPVRTGGRIWDFIDGRWQVV